MNTHLATGAAMCALAACFHLLTSPDVPDAQCVVAGPPPAAGSAVDASPGTC